MDMARKRVTIALWLSGKPGREQLTGIYKYANQCNWDIRILQNVGEFTPSVIRQSQKDGTDGLIVGILPQNDEVLDLLEQSTIPMVSIDIPDYVRRRTQNIAFVKNDDLAIGKRGAEYLKSLGKFNDFGFVGDLRKRKWSDDRAQGFALALAKAGKKVKTFHSPVQGLEADRNIDRSELVSWLRELHKPAAVMTAWDYRATHVLEASKSAKLNIPEQIALLGVDNDELLCETARPTLSSLCPDFEQEGYMAASVLDKLMRRRTVPRISSCSPCNVVERESTRHLTPAAHLVREALAFIDQNACHGVKVADVARHLHVSRRLADLRFSSLQNESIGKALERRKLAEVQRLLKKSHLPIHQIAARSGYANVNRLSHLFTRRFGMSMREYRHTNTSGQ